MNQAPGCGTVRRMETALRAQPPAQRCPRCAAPADQLRCQGCGVWLGGSAARELRWVDAELARLDQSRAWLVNRRIALLAELAATASAPAPAPAPALAPYSTRASGERPGRPERPARPDLSGRAVARLLLAAGAVLVVIPAAAFTVANWTDIGALGRSLILLAMTAIVLTAPVPLRRRGLD